MSEISLFILVLVCMIEVSDIDTRPLLIKLAMLTIAALAIFQHVEGSSILAFFTVLYKGLSDIFLGDTKAKNTRLL